MSDFLSHLLGSALGTRPAVQPILGPQAPPPEVAQAPELPPAPHGPSLARSSELPPPRAPRAAPRASSVPVSVPVPAPIPAPIPDALPSVQGEELVRSVRSPDSLVEDEESPPPAEAGGAEGSARAPERTVALRHFPHPASPAARERSSVDPEIDSDPVDRESVLPEVQPRKERFPSLSEPSRAVKSMNREPQELTHTAKNPGRESQEPSRPAKDTNREPQEPTSPAQSPIRNRGDIPAGSERPSHLEDDSRPARPAFTDSAEGSDRPEVPPAARPPSEPLRRIDQAPERRRIEREIQTPSAPPPVQIRIGRVEVRAVRPNQPAAPVPAPAPAPSAPATSLPDYLRKQRGRS